MAVFTAGKSKRINSPRHLTLRHARRTVSLSKAARGLIDAQDVDDEPNLEPGQERLNSFWAPGLEAGAEHRIEVTQTITAPTADKPLELVAEQDFYVDAPQFSLPPGSVYSVYPPPGYADDCRILPHVVLSDPHLPWERLGSPKAEKDNDERNKVPWLVLFTFTQDELRLAPGALRGVDFKQTTTWTVKMTVKDLWQIPNAATPITAQLVEDAADSTGEFVFLNPDLFKSMFSTFDDDGQRQVPPTPDTSKYKFLSHVRTINTKGMAVGGVEDVGIFSIVIGSRCGPLHQTSPVSVSVHLLSIEGVEDMSFPGAGIDYVALCSLYSWAYTVQPPGMLNVHDAFDHLGQTLGLLRPPDELMEPLKSAGKVPARIASRLEDGYSLVKYRVQTGEQSVALFRGPFTPSVVDQLPQLDTCSNSSQDLQILDQETGIMDVTYAAAWQVGRTLAVGDQSFAAALVRLRTAIQSEALRESKLAAVREAAGSPESLRLRTDVLRDLGTTVSSLDQLHLTPTLGDGNGQFKPGAPAKRWYRRRLKASEYPPLGFHAELVKGSYLDKAKEAARSLAMGTDGTIYNETNTAVSGDWQTVLAWILDRMTLHGVPAHYLITDPSHLGPESLRFFYIDRNWVDALVDGALSLGNHMGEDRDRVAIKTAINDYINRTPQDQPHPPQIPTYGFYLRSDLVSMFPDLRVSVLPEPPKGTRSERAPLLRHEIIADGVMFALLDRIPGSDDFQGLKFTQPSHQQRFAVGWGLGPSLLQIDVRRQYTVDQTDRQRDADRHKPLRQIQQTPTESQNWLVWSTTPQDGADDLRMLRLPYFAAEQLDILNNGMGTFVDGDGKTQRYFEDDTPTSALLAMQLNDPVYFLQVSIPLAAAPTLQSLRPVADGTLPQTLQMLKHSIVQQPVGEDGSDDGRVQAALGQGQLPANVSPDFTRHPLYRPAPSDIRGDLGPHVRSMISEPLSEALASARPHGAPIGAADDGEGGDTAGDTVPAGPPEFSCAVYTLSPGRTTWDSVIPDPQHLAQDLVFSINVSNNNSDYELIEFDVSIPLGPTTGDTNYLLEEYDGPGASMLSNLRFNVLVSTTRVDNDNQLLLRLIPRSSKGWVSIRSVQELGCLLSLAKVNEYDDMRLARIYTSAYYMHGHETNPITDTFDVPILKRPAGAGVGN